MKYLAIDTSNKYLSVSVFDGVKNYDYFLDDCAVKHSVISMQAVEDLLEKANVKLQDLDFIACVTGAGSFTGIRIGISLTKGLCFAKNIKALSITSFDTIAYNEKDGKVLAVIDAGHNGFYVCGYDNRKVVYKPSYILFSELKELEKEYSVFSYDKIDGIKVKKADVLLGLKNAIEDKKDGATYDLNSLTPLYVRKSQAEEGRL